MKEEKTKKTTPKKTAAKKKSTGVKKTTAKKTTTKKTATKKTTTPKKTTTKKVVKKKATPIKEKVEIKVNEELKDKEIVIEEKKEGKNNTDLLLRAILLIAYTLITVILVIGFAETYTKNMKVDSNIKSPYLVEEEIISKDHVLTIENAKSVLSKLDGDYFVYVGYTRMYNSEMQILDMGIAGLINKYDLKDKFYYVSIDSIIEKKNKIELVNNYLGYKDVLISKVPTIAYVNSDNIIRIENIITREDDKLITVGDFQKLLDINQFVIKK